MKKIQPPVVKRGLTQFLFIIVLIVFPGLLSAQQYFWARNIAGAVVKDIKVYDYTGAVYVAGNFSGTVDFDPTPVTYNITSNGGDDIFFAKYTKAGDLSWVRSIGGTLNENCAGLGLDASGDVYLGGTFEGTVDFNPGGATYNLTSAGLTDIFFARYDSLGVSLSFAKQIGTSATELVSAYETDPAGNSFITGTFSDTVDFDPSVGGIYYLNLSSISSDIFFGKYDGTGNLVFAKNLGGGKGYSGRSAENIGFDAGGDIYISGEYFNDSLDFDPGIGTYILNGTDSVVFVAKYTSLGNFSWAHTFHSLNIGLGNGSKSMYVDPPGNVYLTGVFFGSVDFDPSAATKILNGTFDCYMLSYNANGNLKTAIKTTGAGFELGNSIYADALGNMYVTGKYSGTCDFDPGLGTYNLTSASSPYSYDVFLAKYDSMGVFTWASSMGSTGPSDISDHLYLDNNNNIYIAGLFGGTVDFDPSATVNNLTSVLTTDAFFAKYSVDSCDLGALSISGYSDITCTSNGAASAVMNGGTAPYTYLWNTVPVSVSSTVSISDPGIYNVIVMDAKTCIYTRSILFNGPDSTTGFDLDINLMANSFRPGMLTNIWLNGYNSGCTPLSGTISLVLDSMLTYISASPTPSTISGHTLYWNFSNITCDSLHITPVVLVSTPILAIIGDSIDLKAFVTNIAGELDSTNNEKNYKLPIVNSYDPNDKHVFPIGDEPSGKISNDEELVYTIRFQNTGTATALDVYILDQLDEDLDINTVKIIGSSHNMITEVLPGNVLKFRFNHINLPDSSSNEPMSHGYVIFKIRPMSSLLEGTEINNTAGIYFDNNPAIITNTTKNTIAICFPFPIVLSQNGNMLATSTAALTYQWITCNGSILITGATNPNYMATANGDYAVVVTMTNLCSDTSTCLTVNNNSIDELETIDLKIVPNPTTGVFMIDLQTTIAENDLIMTVSDVFGRSIFKNTFTKESLGSKQIDLGELSNGIYNLNLHGKNINANQKFTIQR